MALSAKIHVFTNDSNKLPIPGDYSYLSIYSIKTIQTLTPKENRNTTNTMILSTTISCKVTFHK